jgi:hypothetical protein
VLEVIEHQQQLPVTQVGVQLADRFFAAIE